MSTEPSARMARFSRKYFRGKYATGVRTAAGTGVIGIERGRKAGDESLDLARLQAALTRGDGERGVGPVMAELLEAVIERHRDRQLATMALMVWSEALRNPALAERLEAAAAGLSQDMAAFVRERQQAGTWSGAPADALAQVILSVLPGFLLNLALLGPRGVAGFPAAIRTLWPS